MAEQRVGIQIETELHDITDATVLSDGPAEHPPVAVTIVFFPVNDEEMGPMHDVGLFVHQATESTEAAISSPVFGPLDDERKARICKALFAFFCECAKPEDRDELLAKYDETPRHLGPLIPAELK